MALLGQLNVTWQTEDVDTAEDLYQKRWETMYAKLKAFHAQHHHNMVPSSYVDNALAQWAARQRKGKEKLSPEQVAKLEQLGFVFDIQKQRALSWSTAITSCCFSAKNMDTPMCRHTIKTRSFTTG